MDRHLIEQNTHSASQNMYKISKDLQSHIALHRVDLALDIVLYVFD